MTVNTSVASAADRRGVWGEVAQAVPERGALADAMVRELHEGLTLLGSLPPAVTFFGGARVRAGDPAYAAAERMGELLAARDVPPRTGAGPGIMSAVPEGFRRARAAAGDGAAARAAGEGGPPEGPQGTGQLLTQGFNIVLPFEQMVNPAIDVSLELAHFPTRKLMLYANCLGLVIFPGGFGTLDELLEVWRLAHAGRLTYPFVLYGREFWGPLGEGLTRAAEAVPAAGIPREAFDRLLLTDDAEQAIAHLLASDAPTHGGLGEPLEGLGQRIAHELVEGLGFLESLTPAVTVLGGSRLEEDAACLGAARELARLLAREGVPTRTGGPGGLSVALARGGHLGSAYLPQQAFGMRREDARNLYGADRVHLVNDRLTHKVLLTENARAVVALPGGLGTLDELFSVLCQMQTGKIALRPVVLVGTTFWAPLWDALRATMLDGPRQTIGPHDLALVTMTDDPAEAARLCLTPPAPRPPRTSR